MKSSAIFRLLTTLLEHASEYHEVIYSFVMHWEFKDTLQKCELTPEEWQAIDLVEKWLCTFRDATLEMSSSKHVTLSKVHAIFKTLQFTSTSVLLKLPDNAPIKLRTGLISALHKLSDYYYKFDQSPYYIWASSESKLPNPNTVSYSSSICLPVLDPWIGYDAFCRDLMMTSYFKSMSQLHFKVYESTMTSSMHQRYLRSSTIDSSKASLKKSFLA